MLFSDGDPLEIYTDRDGEVILKKYSPIGEMSSFAKDYTESLFRSLGHIACIVDRDQVVAASGVSKKELWDKPISHDLRRPLPIARRCAKPAEWQPYRSGYQRGRSFWLYRAGAFSHYCGRGSPGAVLLLSREQGARMGIRS